MPKLIVDVPRQQIVPHIICGVCLGTGTAETEGRESDCPCCDLGCLELGTDIFAKRDLALEKQAAERGERPCLK